MDEQARPYQTGALDAALASLAKGHSVLLVLATGLGKTVIFSLLAKLYAQFGRILVLAERRQLVWQAAKELRDWSELNVGIEMGARRCDPAALPPVVVACVPSLRQRRRLDDYPPDAFKLIVIDEAHHAVAKGYLEVLEHFPEAKRVGLTATPLRGDGQALGRIFTEAPFRFDLAAGIRSGWLVPIRLKKVVVTGIGAARVLATRPDLSARELERILAEEKHLQEVAVPLVEHAGARSTLVFTRSRAQAHRLASVINRIRDGAARAIDGTASEQVRASVLSDFKAARFQFLVNCALLGEGFNEPRIACVALDCPGRSPTPLLQKLGRGTRPSPATGKTDLLVLNFTASIGEDQFVTPFDVLAGELEPKLREGARKAAEEGMDLLEAIELTRAELAREEARQREIDERERHGIVAEVRSHLVDVPVGFAQTLAAPVSPPPSPAAPRATDATPEQQIALRRFGVPQATIANLTRHQAEERIAQEIAKARPSVPSPGQARLLRANNISPDSLTAQGAENVLAFIRKLESPELPRPSLRRPAPPHRPSSPFSALGRPTRRSPGGR